MKTSTVIFNINARTLFGEQVYVTGNCKALGNWNVDQAILLRTDTQTFPMWSASYFTRDVDGGKSTWEAFVPNRKLYLTALWSLVDDGRFGIPKERIQVLTSSNYDTSNERPVEVPSNLDTMAMMHKHQEDIELHKMIIMDLERKVSMLQSNVHNMEGQNLKTLNIDQLKELATKSRKVADQASELMMKKMEEEADNRNTFQECVACMDTKIDTIFLPCAHLICCHVCVPKLSGRCPMCKVRIDSFHKGQRGDSMRQLWLVLLLHVWVAFSQQMYTVNPGNWAGNVGGYQSVIIDMQSGTYSQSVTFGAVTDWTFFTSSGGVVVAGRLTVKSAAVRVTTLGLTFTSGITSTGDISLTATNCNFVNSTAGSLIVTGQIIVSLCSFSNNSYNGGGAAISMVSGTLSITGSTFALQQGLSALYLKATALSMTDSSFTSNDLSRGISPLTLLDFSVAAISNCSFLSNKGYNSGAILLDKSQATVAACDFQLNSALYGGAISLQNDSIAVINGCNIGRSSAANYGGGIFSAQSTISVRAVRLTNLEASIGGAVYFQNSNATVVDSFFQLNRGGAISAVAAFGYPMNLTISRCTFDSNASPAKGGAIYTSGSITNLEGSNFINNSATEGGGLYVETNSVVTVKSSTFTGNFAQNYAGAVYARFYTNVIFTNSTFVSNNGTNGAIVGGVGCSIALSGCQVRNNTGAIAAIFTANTVLYLSDTIVAGNKNEVNSGFSPIFISSGTINVQGSTFINNLGSLGGAMYVYTSRGTIDNCTFSNNIGSVGGAIAISGQSVDITKSNFNFNLAGNAGAIYLQQGNTVDGAGGAIFSAGTISLTSSFLSGNVAKLGSGGGIILSNSTGTINNTTFFNQTAVNGAAVYVAARSPFLSVNSRQIWEFKLEKIKVERFSATATVISIDLSTFNTNGNLNNEGGVTSMNSSMTVTNCVFTSNFGSSVLTSLNASNFYVQNISMSLNSVITNGIGAIVVEYTPFVLRYATLVTNSGRNYAGGGISVTASTSGIIDNIIVEAISNQLVCDGTLRLYSVNNITISNSIFRRNTHTCIVCSISNNVNLQNVTVVGNTAMNQVRFGAVYGDQCNIQMNQSNVTNNAYAMATLSVSNSVFSNNAQGAVYANTSTVSIFSNSFSLNSAPFGGAVCVVSGISQIINNNFISNFATSLGGAVFMQQGGISSVNYYYNNTAKYGGAISVQISSTMISRDTFVYNHAQVGGAIYFNTATFSVTGCNFTQNDGTYGGAIGILTSNGSVFSSVLDANVNTLLCLNSQASFHSITVSNSLPGSTYNSSALLVSRSQVTMMNPKVFSNRLPAAGSSVSVIQVDDGTLTVLGGNFTNNDKQSSLGAISGSLFSQPGILAPLSPLGYVSVLISGTNLAGNQQTPLTINRP
ncbi:polymorphic outer membrane protein [Planoprotostelium fungivorum]|uniref:Polymorphic outer membrane protein n=1 Tax=Planoprotostelium fungivorum TaxID=1890364 RepID=A0A2P6NLM9_9EUKA|nr:polymorphic outer membrane protein [Planoprotostelium fungivorum]